MNVQAADVPADLPAGPALVYPPVSSVRNHQLVNIGKRDEQKQNQSTEIDGGVTSGKETVTLSETVTDSVVKNLAATEKQTEPQAGDTKAPGDVSPESAHTDQPGPGKIWD